MNGPRPRKNQKLMEAVKLTGGRVVSGGRVRVKLSGGGVVRSEKAVKVRVKGGAK